MVNFGILTLAASLISSADGVTIWASSGGGWRSMVTNFGYIRAFEQAGIISGSTSTLESASFNSGASWFASQLFYSDKFFARVIGVSPDDIYTLSRDWLNDYENYLGSTSTFFCNLISGFGFISFLAGISDTCNTAFQGSWYVFVRGMLESAAANVYQDSGFADRAMTSGNRVSALANTNLMIQMGLSESSRYGGVSFSAKRNSFITATGESRVLAVPLSTQYTVDGSGESFRYGIESGKTLVTSNEPGKYFFSFADWDEWYRHPAEGISDIYSLHGLADVQPFAAPFNGGVASVAQATSASSASLSSRSGSVPAFLAHHYSVALTDAGNFLGGILVTVQAIFEYGFDSFFDNAVCTKAPDNCGAADGRLIDGGFTDGPSLAQNIGHLHSNGGDLSETLKVILTNNNFKDDSNAKVLSYFETPFNTNVAPGDFIWAPFTVPDSRSAQETPWRSPQIFSESLDDGTLTSAFDIIAGTAITTAVYTGTTVSNPAFGVQAGQNVEILLLQINSDIPVNFLFRNNLVNNKEALAQLSKTIAGSTELVTRIQSFLA